MELILKQHDNVNDPIWSVIIGLIVFLLGASYYILYIMRISYKELEENGSDGATKSEELL